MKLAPYNGQVGTYCHMPDALVASFKEFMSTTPHDNPNHDQAFTISLANWYVDPTTHLETGTGATSYVQSTIEYPAGVFTDVLFSGTRIGVIPDLTTLESDPIPLAIPKGVRYWVRTFCQNAGGACITTNDSSALGTGATGGTTTPNLLRSGTVAAGDACMPPVRIRGITTYPSIFVGGDSISNGLGDKCIPTIENKGHFGSVAPSIGESLAYINCSRSGELADEYKSVTGNLNRKELMASCSHYVSCWGFNDCVNGGFTADQILVNLRIIWAFARAAGKKVYQTTMTPRATSTDVWTTPGNQTVDATITARKTALNALIKADTANLDGVFDLESILEDQTTDGKWKVIPGAVAITITAITAAAPGVLTSVAHGLAVDDCVHVTGATGTTQVNKTLFVGTVPSADTFTLSADLANATPVTTTGVFGGTCKATKLAYTQDGTHPTHAAYQAIKNSGIISPATFFEPLVVKRNTTANGGTAVFDQNTNPLTGGIALTNLVVNTGAATATTQNRVRVISGFFTADAAVTVALHSGNLSAGHIIGSFIVSPGMTFDVNKFADRRTKKGEDLKITITGNANIAGEINYAIEDGTGSSDDTYV